VRNFNAKTLRATEANTNIQTHLCNNFMRVPERIYKIMTKDWAYGSLARNLEYESQFAFG